MKERIIPKCKYCKSDDVAIDAWAKWDINKQTFVLHETFEQEYCFRCSGETTLVWEECDGNDETKVD
jgi:hypothetical protein